MINTFIYIIIFIAIIAIGIFLYFNFKNNDKNTNNTNSSYNASRTDVNVNINDNNINMNVNDNNINSNTENIINQILPTYKEVSSFTTKIYDKDSARQNNVQKTCNTLNNTEVLPGATFSFTSIIRKSNN